MPYDAPEYAQSTYSFVATEGSQRPYQKLWATQLRQIFAFRMRANPRMPIVGLVNACLSGGNLKFMKTPKEPGTWWDIDRKPIFLMSSAPPLKEAQTGGLWVAWFSILDTVLSQDGAGAVTLGDLYEAADELYIRQMSHDLVNVISSHASLEDPLGSYDHTNIVRAAIKHPGGIRWDWLKQASPSPFATMLCRKCNEGSGSFPSTLYMCGSCFREWNALTEEERSKVQLNPVNKVRVDLVEITLQALAEIARPQCAHGEKSRVASLTLREMYGK